MTGSPVAPLPPAVVPFGVRAMPHVRPDLWPLARPVPPYVEDDGPRTLVRLDAEVAQLVAAAREQVTTDPAPWTSHAPDLTPADAIAAGLALDRGDATQVAERLSAVPAEHRLLEAVALAVAEDVVLVDATGRGPIAELTFRAERQTTLPLAALGFGVFLIRVLRAPLHEIAASTARRVRLAEAIDVLPPELARYKGVADRRDELLAWLAASPVPRR